MASADLGAEGDARRLAERVARLSYGKLLAAIAARSRDVAAAEDALSDAFAAALDAWPRTGAPASPEAWLITAARRRLIDGARRAQVAEAATAETLRRLEERLEQQAAAAGSAADDAWLPDERLTLMAICAHPAIDPSAQTPLMLQTVLGLDAGRIASAFLVAPATMGQRLTRAKRRIRDAGLLFEAPPPEAFDARLKPLLQAVYAAFGAAWDEPVGAEPRRGNLRDEAIWLGRALVEASGRAAWAGALARAEAKGLLALMLHCAARAPARRDVEGAYTPLSDQEPTLWSRPMIDEAEAWLRAAADEGAPGRFQLEAAIQSAHAARAVVGRADWPAIVGLYDALLALAPSLGAAVARAAALDRADGPAASLAALDTVAEPKNAAAIDRYQPYWAARAHALAELGRADDARRAFDRAIGLAEDPAVRTFLFKRRQRLG